MPWVSGNYYLSLDDTINNGNLAASEFRRRGWSVNAIAAVLGNMQSESGINPGIWEMLTPEYIPEYGRESGYGLTQWTPYTKYSDWAGTGWENNGPKECERVDFEAENGLQWGYNTILGLNPPISFKEFKTSRLPVDSLAEYFLYFYENPADPVGQRAIRQQQALEWYKRLGGGGGGGLTTIPIWLLFKIRRDNFGGAYRV